MKSYFLLHLGLALSRLEKRCSLRRMQAFVQYSTTFANVLGLNGAERRSWTQLNLLCSFWTTICSCIRGPKTYLAVFGVMAPFPAARAAKNWRSATTFSLGTVRMTHQVPTSTPVPMPADWAKLHSALSKAWRERNSSSTPAPPVPLILAGAAFSTAAEILQRWIDLVQWANDSGLGQCLAALLPPSPNLDVADRISGISDDGQGGWREFGEQYHTPKKRPSPKEIDYALAMLRKNWKKIVGDEIAGITKPLLFRGHKRRRLVVAANPNKSAPWGGWWSARKNRRAFTAFRSSVNASIHPMEVDEVTFDTHRWDDRQRQGVSRTR